MKKTRDDLKILLVQLRRDQITKNHEITCFSRSADVRPHQVTSHDLLESSVPDDLFDEFDGLVIGGGGDVTAFDEIPNIASLEIALRQARERRFPVIGACWGAQYISVLFGGKVSRGMAMREIGTLAITKDAAALTDPLFADLPAEFMAQVSHNDCVIELPAGAVLLAHSRTCPVEAFTFPGSRMYAVQFHPELDKDDLILRFEHFRETYGESAKNNNHNNDDVLRRVLETPESAVLIGKWIDKVVLAD